MPPNSLMLLFVVRTFCSSRQLARMRCRVWLDFCTQNSCLRVRSSFESVAFSAILHGHANGNWTLYVIVYTMQEPDCTFLLTRRGGRWSTFADLHNYCYLRFLPSLGLPVTIFFTIYQADMSCQLLVKFFSCGYQLFATEHKYVGLRVKLLFCTPSAFGHI